MPYGESASLEDPLNLFLGAAITGHPSRQKDVYVYLVSLSLAALLIAIVGAVLELGLEGLFKITRELLVDEIRLQSTEPNDAPLNINEVVNKNFLNKVCRFESSDCHGLKFLKSDRIFAFEERRRA